MQNKPTDLNAAARLFLYYQNQKNAGEAQRALQAFRLAKDASKEPWTTAELWTLGNLFENLPDVNEAARCFYAMYSVPGATESSAEQALGALANLLLNSADQPIAFGSGDLSLYRDIAKVDESPGFLNGILSLLFNSASTARELQPGKCQIGGVLSEKHRGAAGELAGPAVSAVGAVAGVAGGGCADLCRLCGRPDACCATGGRI